MPRPLDFTNARDIWIGQYEQVMLDCHGPVQVPHYDTLNHRILVTYYQSEYDADTARRREAERMADRQLRSIALGQVARQQRLNASPQEAG